MLFSTAQSWRWKLYIWMLLGHFKVSVRVQTMVHTICSSVSAKTSLFRLHLSKKKLQKWNSIKVWLYFIKTSVAVKLNWTSLYCTYRCSLCQSVILSVNVCPSRMHRMTPHSEADERVQCMWRSAFVIWLWPLVVIRSVFDSATKSSCKLCPVLWQFITILAIVLQLLWQMFGAVVQFACYLTWIIIV